MSYQTIEVKPLADALGAEIFGVELSQELTNQAFDEIHRAYLDHQVIFFRDQNLTPGQLSDFGRRFGPLNIYPFVEGLAEAPEVLEILKTETDVKNFGGAWHSDTAYLERPPLGTMLYAHEVPRAGGDTLFANAHLAYESLSDGMKDLIKVLVGVNSAALTLAGGRRNLSKGYTGMQTTNLDKVAAMVAEHPVVRTHPETGRKALYLSRQHTVRFKDMSVEESRPLIDYLSRQITRPEFTCRFRWRVGLLAFWDNRSTQHYAINDYSGARRCMYRLTVEGDRPS